MQRVRFSRLYFLHLIDRTLELKSSALCTLALLNPNLTSLRIDFCGCLDNATISAWCTSLPSLTRLELLGPFLVRVSAWKAFFESHPRLEGFLITQSPRFDLECMESLVVNCKGLKELRLKEVGKMTDGFVDFLKRLKSGLTYLDLSYPGESLSEEALIELAHAVGPTLNHLDLSKHDLITDAFLLEGIKPHFRKLTSLILSGVPELTDDGVAAFFSSWVDVPDPKKRNPPLVSLDLSRNYRLSANALNAILAHSGAALHFLSINGWKATSEDALSEIAKSAQALRMLDVGWCREMNDFVVKGLMEKCNRIQEVKAWGCSRLTANCPRKVRTWGYDSCYRHHTDLMLQRGVNIYGIESHSAL
jgi:DNA repair protein RAD7